MGSYNVMGFSQNRHRLWIVAWQHQSIIWRNIDLLSKVLRDIHLRAFVKVTKMNSHSPLQWRHNGCDDVSNQQPHDCLLYRLFGRRSKKTSKLRVTGLCERNLPVTGEFPAQSASNAENVSIRLRHRDKQAYYKTNSKHVNLFAIYCNRISWCVQRAFVRFYVYCIIAPMIYSGFCFVLFSQQLPGVPRVLFLQ